MQGEAKALAEFLPSLLADLPDGSHIAVVTMTGSCCPVTLAHVQCFMEARRLLLAEAARPRRMEVFQEVLAFLSLNGDAHVSSKMRQKNEPYIQYKDRAMLVELACSDLPWMSFNAGRENAVAVAVQRAWPKLHVVRFSLNGADDVLKYQKWRHCSREHRLITMGRPGGYTEKLKTAIRRAGIDPEEGNFIVGPELPDVSSTEVRRVCRMGDVECLSQLLDSRVAAWCLNEGPYRPQPKSKSRSGASRVSSRSHVPSVSGADVVRECARAPIATAESRPGLQGVFQQMVCRKVANPARPSSAPQSVPLDDSCEVFLVRHGERVDEVRGAEHDAWLASIKNGNQQHFDPPLTMNGKAQAVSSARMLRAKLAGTAPVDVIFSSPLQRCVCTAAPFAEAFGVPIQIVHGLGECCAALSLRNTSSNSRWNRLLTMESLQRLCPGVSFVKVDSTKEAFLERDSTCLGRLAQGRPRIIAVSHRESIRHLASRRAGCSARLPTPYACIAVFRCIWLARARNSEQWRHEGFVAGCNTDRFLLRDPRRADDDDDPAAAELGASIAESQATQRGKCSVASSVGAEAMDLHD